MNSQFSNPATGYYSCVIFQLDQFPINILNNQRKNVRVLFRRVNSWGTYINEVVIQYMYMNDESYWTDVCQYVMDETGQTAFQQLYFYTFNFTKDTAKIYRNGQLKASASFPQYTPLNYEFKLEKAYFPQNKNTYNSNELDSNQIYLYSTIFFYNFQTLSDFEADVLYKFVSDTLSDTLKVNGVIQTNAIYVDNIYQNGKEVAFNDKAIYEAAPAVGKITTQTSGGKRSLSIDTVKVNSLTI